MAIAYETWTVLPHGPWQELAENLWCVEGTLDGPMRGWPRTMSAIRRADGTLILHSAVALHEADMDRLEAWGRPTILVVPNGSHRSDALVYKKRYPDLRIYCPANNRENVEVVVPVDGSYDDLPADETVRAEHLAGENGWEGVIHVRSRDGMSLLFADTISWVADLPEPARSTVEPGGFVAEEPVFAEMARRELMRDREALRAHLLQLAHIPDLVRIVPGHGAVITRDPAAVLRKIAATL